MDGEDYLVFSGERGFWGSHGQWTSQYKDAATFTRDHAITFCKKHRSAADALGAVPVREADILELMMTK